LAALFFCSLNEDAMREPIVNIAVRAARAAGNTIQRSMDRIDSMRIIEKMPNDFVTEIDQKVEAEIIGIIQKAYPSHSILSEECGEIEGTNPDYVWIIDPIDGTRNFIHGLPHFAVSIAISYKGKVEHGVIYDPIRQELFSASKGKGARVNDRRMRVSTRKNIEECLLGTGCPSRHSKEKIEAYTDSIKAVLPLCGDVRRAGAATLDLAYVACGRLDGFWEAGLKIWDVAAGSLMIKEAGGIVCDFAGGEDYLNSGNIVTGNPKIVKILSKTIGPYLIG
jgi:myo-inositol-1(or 4)-monophosphatase